MKFWIINALLHKFFSINSTKFGSQEVSLYKVYINDDPGLTMTYFTARSNWVICTFEWGKLL